MVAQQCCALGARLRSSWARVLAEQARAHACGRRKTPRGVFRLARRGAQSAQQERPRITRSDQTVLRDTGNKITFPYKKLYLKKKKKTTIMELWLQVILLNLENSA